MIIKLYTFISAIISSLLCTTGYAARNAMNNTACKDLFVNKHNTMGLQVEQEHLKYTEHFDRGGLIYPSNSSFEVMHLSYNIFNMCMTSEIYQCTQPKTTLIGIIEQYITSNDDYWNIPYLQGV